MASSTNIDRGPIIIWERRETGKIEPYPDGIVKILDFGIARLPDQGTSGPLLGTGYMSPEQALAWPVAKRRPQFLPLADRGMIFTAHSWSPDGRWLAERLHTGRAVAARRRPLPPWPTGAIEEGDIWLLTLK